MPALLVGERISRGPDWRWGDWIGDQQGTVAAEAEPLGWWWIRYGWKEREMGRKNE